MLQKKYKNLYLQIVKILFYIIKLPLTKQMLMYFPVSYPYETYYQIETLDLNLSGNV